MHRVALIRQVALLITRVYIIIALVIAALFSQLVLSVIPLLLAVVYLYLWWHPIRPAVHLLLDYFIFFALAILFSPWLRVYSFLMALPVLLPVHTSLLKTAMTFHYRKGGNTRQLSSTSISLFIINFVVLIIAILFENPSLALAVFCVVIYLVILQVLAWKHIPGLPVEAQLIEQRMVTGTEDTIHIRLKIKTKYGGNLFLQSPHTWLRINTDFISLRETEEINIDITLKPPLAGPSDIKLPVYVTDRWDMLQYHYEITPMKLYVIPRARYAAWLARKYLEGTAPGTLPLVSALRPFQLQNAAQRGIEYYGNRPYQAGDSLKSIDWKHSLKFNELVSKDFREFHGQAALLLVNLAVTNTEKGDELAYNIITAALSLAQENIPTIMAAYNHKQVIGVTPFLLRQSLVTHALETAQAITYLNDDKRYLAFPDISHLRGNLARIRSSQSASAATLGQLLQIEYRSIAQNARNNPATEALSKACSHAGREFSIVVISQRNHDADALAFNAFSYRQQGHAVIEINGARV